jgi:hypothetical protein
MNDSLPINHEEAYQLACLKQEESNLARCYIELHDGVSSLSPERIDEIAAQTVNSMPEGMLGFMKVWGWQQFATAITKVLKSPLLDGTKLWLWKNGDHFLAFDNEYPCFSPGGDPMTLGEPVGTAILKSSFERSRKLESNDKHEALIAEIRDVQARTSYTPDASEQSRTLFDRIVEALSSNTETAVAATGKDLEIYESIAKNYQATGERNEDSES